MGVEILHRKGEVCGEMGRHHIAYIENAASAGQHSSDAASSQITFGLLADIIPTRSAAVYLFRVGEVIAQQIFGADDEHGGARQTDEHPQTLRHAAARQDHPRHSWKWK